MAIIQQLSKHKWTIFSIIILIIIVKVIPKIPGFTGDIGCWRDWTLYIYKNGLENTYDSGTNYLPVYQYVLYCFGKIAGNEQNIIKYSFFLRYLSLIIDIIGIWFIYKWIKKSISSSC